MCTRQSLEFLDDKPSYHFRLFIPSYDMVGISWHLQSTPGGPSTLHQGPLPPFNPTQGLKTFLYGLRCNPLPLHITLVLIGTPFTYIHDLKFYSVCLFEIFKTMAFKHKNCKLSILFCILQIVKSVPYPFRVSHLVKSAIRNTFPPTPRPQFPWVFTTID